MAEQTEVNFPTTYNRELIFDLTLNAFIVYDFDHTADSATAPRLHDYIPISSTVKSEVEEPVLDNAGNVVVDGSGNTVTGMVLVTGNRTRESRRERFKFLVSTGTSVTIAEFKDYGFRDFASAVTNGWAYDSYIITGHDISGDFMRKKQAIYLLVYCKRTETVYADDGAGNIIPVRPSSCKVQSRWEWNISDAQGKWGKEFQAYRLFLPKATNPASGDSFDYGESVIVTKNKLRGRGQALSLKFTAEDQKDLIILGWGILGYKNDNP